MRAFRDYILNEIKTRVTDFRDVRMYNNQFDHSNNDDISQNDEAPFDYPCCFVELSIQEVRQVAIGIKYVDIIVRLHIGIEEYLRERELDYTFIDDIDDKLLGMRGDSIDTVQFSSWIENTTDLDENFNNINRPVLEYRTTYTRTTNNKRKNLITKLAPTNLNVIGDTL